MGKKGRHQRGQWRPRPGPSDFNGPPQGQRGWGPTAGPFGGGGPGGPPMHHAQHFQQGNIGFRPPPQQGFDQQQPQHAGWGSMRRPPAPMLRPGPPHFNNRPPQQFHPPGYGDNSYSNHSYGEGLYASPYQSHRPSTVPAPTADIPRDRDLRTALPDVLQALGASLSAPLAMSPPQPTAPTDTTTDYEPLPRTFAAGNTYEDRDASSVPSGSGRIDSDIYGRPSASPPTEPTAMRRGSATSSLSSSRATPVAATSDDKALPGEIPSISTVIEATAPLPPASAVSPSRSPHSGDKGKQREQTGEPEEKKIANDAAVDVPKSTPTKAAHSEELELKSLDDKFNLWKVPPDIDVRPREREDYYSRDRDRDQGYRMGRRENENDDGYRRRRDSPDSARWRDGGDRRRQRSHSSESYTSEDRHRLRRRRRDSDTSSMSRSPSPRRRSSPRSARREDDRRTDSRRDEDSRRDAYNSRRYRDRSLEQGRPVSPGVQHSSRDDHSRQNDRRYNGHDVTSVKGRSVSPTIPQSSRVTRPRPDERSRDDDRRGPREPDEEPRDRKDRDHQPRWGHPDHRNERRRSRSPERNDRAASPRASRNQAVVGEGWGRRAGNGVNDQRNRIDDRTPRSDDRWSRMDDDRKSRENDRHRDAAYHRRRSTSRARSPSAHLDRQQEMSTTNGRLLARKSPVLMRRTPSPPPVPRKGGWTVVSENSHHTDSGARSRSPREVLREQDQRVDRSPEMSSKSFMPATAEMPLTSSSQSSEPDVLASLTKDGPSSARLHSGSQLDSERDLPRFVPRPRDSTNGAAANRWSRPDQRSSDDDPARQHGQKKTKRKKKQQQQQQQRHQTIPDRGEPVSDKGGPSAAMLAAMAAAAGEVGDPSILSALGEQLPSEAESSTAASPRYSSPPRAGLGEGYTRIALVGEGTYGLVYKARAETSGVLVALKKIRMESEKDGFPVTAIREVKLLQSLRHPNIVRLHEMMVSKGSVYMVFEYMQHDLNGVISQPDIKFTPAHLKSLALQLLQGLEFLHRKSILHRDLKGSNILLDNTGTLKLADFGLARYYLKRREGDYTNRVVTLWYRPPELLFGATKYGPEIDMWGAGCIFLELFTRRTPFPGNDEIHQVQVITDLMGPVTSEAWPGVETLPWFDLVRPLANEPADDDMDGEPLDKPANKFTEIYASQLTPGAMAVAEQLLLYDPRARISATDALKMSYFEEELPRPEAPAGLLSSLEGEWHEYESRKARKQRQADASAEKGKAPA